MKPTAIFLAGAILGALGVLALRNPQPGPAVSQLAELRKTNAAQTAEIEQQRHEIAAQNDTIHQLHTTVTETSHLAAPPPAKPQNPLAGLATLMDNPAMKKMMAASQQKVIEDNYADFIDQLHLSPEERAKFVELLSAKQSISTDYGMKVLKATPEERKELSARMKADGDKADADIREFLNSDTDYARYEAYTGELPQRMELRTMQPAFERIGQPLSATQQTNLLALMEKERQATPPSASADDPTLSADSSARLVREQEELQTRVAAGATTILSPPQLKVFREKQASTLEMMKIGFEMSRVMLGDDPEKKPTP